MASSLISQELPKKFQPRSHSAFQNVSLARREERYPLKVESRNSNDQDDKLLAICSISTSIESNSIAILH